MPVSGGHARGRHVGPRLKPVPPVSRPVVPSDRPGISWIKGQEKEGKASQVKSSQVKSSQVKSSQVKGRSLTPKYCLVLIKSWCIKKL
jgi:hypothetical protein